jgi:hypothetical protein
MPKIKIIRPNNPAVDLSSAFDAKDPSTGQAAFNKMMTPQVRQHVTAALSHHMGINDMDPGNNPPAATHQDLEGQQEMASSEALQNTADMGNPPVIPASAPAKAPKAGLLGSPADFSSL